MVGFDISTGYYFEKLCMTYFYEKVGLTIKTLKNIK